MSSGRVVLRRRERPGVGQATRRASRRGRLPGHPDVPELPRGALDDEWLPIVGANRLVVITCDRRIRYRPAERMAWVRHGVRGFVLTGKRSQSTSDSPAVLETHWGRIEPLVAAEPQGPWMRSITSSGMGVIDLA